MLLVDALSVAEMALAARREALFSAKLRVSFVKPSRSLRMTLTDVLGYAAASLTTVSFVPQAAKTLRTGDTAAISLRMYLLFTSGVALWGIYGVLRGDGPLVVANAITLVSAGLILQSKLRAVLAGKR
jgi:MtN3 and saliva related transmembrane protein